MRVEERRRVKNKESGFGGRIFGIGIGRKMV